MTATRSRSARQRQARMTPLIAAIIRYRQWAAAQSIRRTQTWH